MSSNCKLILLYSIVTKKTRTSTNNNVVTVLGKRNYKFELKLLRINLAKKYILINVIPITQFYKKIKGCAYGSKLKNTIPNYLCIFTF